MASKIIDARRLNVILVCSALVLLSSVVGGLIMSGFEPQLTPVMTTEKTTLVEDILTRDGEIRALWIATVANINFPSESNLTSEELKAEIDSILTTALENSMNTVIFQVRPSSDALYASSLFPSSEFLCGAQGNRLPLDTLEYLTTEAHKLDIAVCAWVNPLRVSTSMNASEGDPALLSENNPAFIHPEYCIGYNGSLYYDPGLPEVRALISEGVKEIAEGYPVDAIIFDDYFYPYPVENEVYDDSASYAKYGNGMDLEDWRRENVNAMIKSSHDIIKAVRPDCYFGISPFGIWCNNDGTNNGSDTKGLSAFSAIYCDALAWIEGGYIDFISPQLYWSFDTEAAPYGVLCDWWDKALADTDIPLIVSHGAYRAGEWSSPTEISDQIEYARQKKSYMGSAFYGYSAIKANSNGICQCFKEVY
ncbi:MAG: family 10 glycosylhydrolase [Clostridia bacterium]|nr:family 10 glycosylhydrolase [Clostridia bacterium]